MKELLDRFDGRKLARQADPALYRSHVAEFLGHYEEIRTGRDLSADRVASFIASSGKVMRQIKWKTDGDLVAMIFSVMRSEVPRLAEVGQVFAMSLDRLYNREERTRENVGNLWRTSLFEIERIKSETTFADRLFSKEWRFAKRMRSLSGRKIEAFNEAERPTETVVYVPVPQQSGGWQPGTPSYRGF